MRILDLLTSNKDEKATKIAERISRQLKRNQERLLDNLDAKMDKLLSKKESLESIDVKITDAAIDSWNESYHTAVVEIALVKAEIVIAKNTLLEMFEDEG